VPVLVTVAGGTLSGAFGQVNGVTIGDVNTRVFLLPRGQAITLNWSVAPTGWVWQAVG
jgi:7-keto-8-aminopelargonate synthetase-like enzyme